MREPVERALRQLLEAREARRKEGPSAGPGGLRGSSDDWQAMALAELADGILLLARKNYQLRDEVRALRDEVRRLRARRSAA